jgi:monoamine oxidase
MGRSFYSDLTPSLTGRSAGEREARIAALVRQQAKDEVVVPQACRGLFSDTSVAVIGGGLGGLSAARELASKGAIVTVFEARGEVGGRVLSNTTFATGRIVEYGAELVGANHPMGLSLARRYQLGLIGRSDAVLHGKAGFQARLELDRLLTLDEQLALAEEMKRRVFVPLGKLASKIIDPAQPWLQPALATFDSISVAAFLKGLGIAAGSRLHLGIEHLLVNNNVAPLDQLNLLGLMCLVKGGQFGPQDTQLMGYWEELEIFRAAEGCQTLARAMAGEFATAWRGRFKMRCAVTKIDLSKRPDITWNELDKDGRMLKTGQAGFDFVVLAIPPSVWGDVTITPLHPMDPKQVGVMRTGPAVKHFSAMDNRVWMASSSAPLGGAVDLGQVWEGTDNQMRGRGQKVVLNVFAGGRIPSAFEPGLERLFRGYANAGVQTQLMNWPAEPFIRCGYASPAKDQIFSVGQALNKPFAKRMVFAGEHTSMAYFGYMEGALQSGRRAARQVVALACSKERHQPAPRTQIARAATEEEVIGADDRVHVSNAFDMPARWVCAIDIYGRNPADGSEVLADQRATGILIGPCHVLTAAHVFGATSIRVKDKVVRVPVLRARVSPGRNGDNDDHPLGWAWSKSIQRVLPYTDETDYALIELDRDLSKATHKKMSGALGYWGQMPSQAALRALDPKTLVDTTVTVIGYPGDRCGTQALTGNAKEKLAKITYCVQRQRDIWASTPWRASGALFADPNSAKLEYTADTYEGESGGPICLNRDQVLELVGVHGGEVPPPSGQPVARNRGARVTPDMLKQLRDWINKAAGKTIADVRNDALVFVAAPAHEAEDGLSTHEAEAEAGLSTPSAYEAWTA